MILDAATYFFKQINRIQLISKVGLTAHSRLIENVWLAIYLPN